MRFIDKGNGPKGGQYLRCSANVRGMGCVTTAWRYDDFEETFFTYVDGIDLVAVLGAKAADDEKARNRERLAVLRARLADLSEKRERTFALLGESEASREFISGKLDEISRECPSSGIWGQMAA
jgi:hypothetical protein